jgi:cyclase
MRQRVIPCLLLLRGGLVKTVKYKKPTYLGDPINTVRIFNDKEVDELVFLDITATNEQRKPPFDIISQIATECFMPLGYGGGIRDIEDVRRILNLGVEKVIINTYAVERPDFVSEAANLAGSSSVVISIDVKKDIWGHYKVFINSGRKNTGLDPVKFAVEMQHAGAGEIILNSIDRDGVMQGYDLELIEKVSAVVNIPVVACGGAGNIQDLVKAVKVGAAAAAAGSMFVFQGQHRAVLISYPSRREITEAFQEQTQV